MEKATELIVIKPMETEQERIACAEIMSRNDPWKTLKRDFQASLKLLGPPSREVYVAVNQASLAGFVVIIMSAAFSGYIQSLAVAEDYRGRGVGSQLMQFAETRIFKDSPNVFLCVSSFNPEAGKFYEQRGYEKIGELKDYIIAGHSEIILRKSLGPINEFRKEKA